MLDPGRWVDVFILAETAATLAAVTTVESGADVRCAAMSIHHQRVATLESGSLVARATLVHSGRAHTLVEVSVEDGRGRPIMGAFASMVPAGASTAGDDPSVEATWPTPDPWMRDYELAPVVRGNNVKLSEAHITVPLSTDPYLSPFTGGGRGLSGSLG